MGGGGGGGGAKGRGRMEGHQFRKEEIQEGGGGEGKESARPDEVSGLLQVDIVQRLHDAQ